MSEYQCDFIFDNNLGRIYYAGETISGVAILELTEEIHVEKVELIIEGTGECKWEESREVRNYEATNTRILKTTYRNQEQYLNSVTLLIPNETRMQPNRYSFNFRYKLPSIIPSSMDEKFGHVVYRVILKLNRPREFDVNFMRTFTLICPIDFELNPSWLLPCEQEEIKRYGCGCCKTEPINLTVKMPKSAYTPGENIIIETRVDNPSDIFISQLEINMIKKIVYESNYPRIKQKTQEFLIFEKEIPEPIAKQSKVFQLPLVVPKATSTKANPSNRAITITYEIWVRAKTPGVFTSPIVKIPILIGAAPRSEPLPPPPPVEQSSTSLQVPASESSTTPFAAFQQVSTTLATTSTSVPNNSTRLSSSNIRTPTAPVIPSDPTDDPPPSFDEVMRNRLPYIVPETVRNYNIVRPLGFVIPNETPETTEMAETTNTNND